MFKLLFFLAFVMVSCSEVNVTVHRYPVCNFKTLTVTQYMKLKTKTGFLYVHKVSGQTCEVTQ